jgi:hypothetical protein
MSNKNNDLKNNYFADVKSMLALSLGRLPTALVVILLLSSAMAALAGVLLEFGTPSKSSKEFMPFRIEASQNAESLALVDSKKLQGNWIYQTPTYAMTLTLIGDRFEWIIAFADIAEAQYYARGNFRMKDDVMVLGVRTDLGIPQDPSKPWVKFFPIAMKDINLHVSFEGKNLIWTVPISEQNRLISRTSIIFEDNNDGVFKWKK